MNRIRLIPATFVLIALIPAAGRAADLCVQNPGSIDYRSDNPAITCALPQVLPKRDGPGITDVSKEMAGRSIEQLALPVTVAGPVRWQLRAEDGSVYAALKRWSSLAGWQVSWEIPVDFPIEIEDDATGTYEQAVQRVLTALRVSDYPPHPCFHQNRVVRVVRRIQGNGDECK